MAPVSARGDATNVVRALAGSFPTSVVTRCVPVDAPSRPAYPEEEAAVAGAVPRRRREFLAGRTCAHDGLRELGVEPRPIGRGDAREPLWPPGVVGSISHTRDTAAAAVAHDRDAWGLGLDLEPLAPSVDVAVDRLVRTPAERRRVAGAHPLRGHLAKATFCAKECVFKALFPSTGWRLGFHDVTVEVDLSGEAFRAVLDRRFHLAGHPVGPLEGRLTIVDGHLLAGLWIPPGGPTG